MLKLLLGFGKAALDFGSTIFNYFKKSPEERERDRQRKIDERSRKSTKKIGGAIKNARDGKTKDLGDILGGR